MGRSIEWLPFQKKRSDDGWSPYIFQSNPVLSRRTRRVVHLAAPSRKVAPLPSWLCLFIFFFLGEKKKRNSFRQPFHPIQSHLYTFCPSLDRLLAAPWLLFCSNPLQRFTAFESKKSWVVLDPKSGFLYI
jgi:hypothetical protein